MTPDPYLLFLFGLGGVILLVAWLPLGLKRAPLSLAIVCVAIGGGGVQPGRPELQPRSTNL